MRKIRQNLNLLPVGILLTPSPVDTFAFNNMQKEIEYIDDERLVIKKERISIFLSMLCLAGVLIGVPFFFSILIGPTWLSIILGVLLLFALAFILISEYADTTDKYPYECEFNRKNRTITYSKFKRFNPKREIRTFPFIDCQFEATISSTREESSEMLVISNYSHDEFFRLSIYCEKEGICGETMNNIFETYSFLQWYMDKNRPLPPGKVFDQYRQQDYKIRMSKGLKEPLTASLVEMLEYNSEPCTENEENNSILINKLDSRLE